MSQTAPPSDKKKAKSAASPQAPPDERFWQRYSPHAELPLSSAGSLVAHVLVFGFLILASVLSTLLFNQANRALPVEAVQLSGGGGDPHGRGEGPHNAGDPVEAANPSSEQQAADTVPPVDTPPPTIDVKPDKVAQPEFNDSPARKISENSDNTLRQLSNRVDKIRTPGSNSSSPSGYGKGGTGSGGGSGGGRGDGIGNANGPGKSTPSQREKRMLRWSMLFNTTNSSDYVAQLRGLGAILAIPVREDAASGVCDYKVLRDLSTSHPAKFSDEDIHNITRLVSWRDESPESVSGVMAVLRLSLKPSHFLAFMPVELEEKLLRLEIEYLNTKHRGRKEDDIEGTKFRVKVRSGKYEPEVREQKLR